MTCVVKNDGLIGERKGVNMPNVNISLPAITERDRQDILFGLTENIDYIAASFIRDGESVRGIRELCRGERWRARDDRLDRVRPGRRELRRDPRGFRWHHGCPWRPGHRMKPELVPHIQKEIVAKCNAAYKPVITATQMLDSMQQNPRPTRAEGCRRC